VGLGIYFYWTTMANRPRTLPPSRDASIIAGTENSRIDEMGQRPKFDSNARYSIRSRPCTPSLALSQTISSTCTWRVTWGAIYHNQGHLGESPPGKKAHIEIVYDARSAFGSSDIGGSLGRSILLCDHCFNAESEA
jgi:hypothetical protein